MLLKELSDYIATELHIERFKDYCPNGLQVEGCAKVKRLAIAVSASQAVLEQAAAWEADALLVHHGYFWRGENAVITGLKKQRLACLLKHDISLLAYHLPLDAHAVWGNNAQLAVKLGFKAHADGEYRRFGDQDMVWSGRLPKASSLSDLAWRVTDKLQRTPQVVGDLKKKVHQIAWCSGGAQGYFQQAIDQGVDVYLTGEISEPQYHLAQESGVAFVAAGHHATERYGVQALAAHLSDKFDLHTRFFDQDNPV